MRFIWLWVTLLALGRANAATLTGSGERESYLLFRLLKKYNAKRLCHMSAVACANAFKADLVGAALATWSSSDPCDGSYTGVSCTTSGQIKYITSM